MNLDVAAGAEHIAILNNFVNGLIFSKKLLVKLLNLKGFNSFM